MKKILIITIILYSGLFSQVRIKDIVSMENATETTLVGYGLVTGLDGTGDRASRNYGSVFTVQTITNMLERFGITVPRENLRTRNVAAVMITANSPAFARIGTRFDVTVSSLGDATSLEGGILLMAPLLDAGGKQYAMAQGPISVGGYNIETSAGEKVRKNHALTGRIPAGAVVNTPIPSNIFDFNQPIRFLLHEPDFVTASRIAESINGNIPSDSLIAHILNAGVVEVRVPDSLKSSHRAAGFLAQLESLEIAPDVEARVVINERTGTVVAGGNVTISEIMVSHGSLTIHIRRRPVISQPSASFASTGTTVVEFVTETTAKEDIATTAAIRETSSVQDLAAALNELGLRPRDVIAIFQSIKQAGALNAELIII
ncbi:MAG: flagellar basal body P-ring protein FlgI [Candidatus Marinimicrobia bacterium]|nr:flagellar basal body P-ring protein FlgI [Candidatus Neomarinimicrobiota bacterium]